MDKFNVVAELNNATVVSEYNVQYGGRQHSDAFQSEAELENEFVRLLEEQSYEYLPIRTEKDLIANLRLRLEELNNIQFSDNEWKKFFKNNIANEQEHIVEKTRKIQHDYIQVLERDDGSSCNIRLINKDNIHSNKLQVINQYTEERGVHENRYDVTVLVNGLPLVHIELKRRGVSIREAFHQIERYQRESFWSASGLYEYVQIFVISNGTHTKYYSNTTRNSAIDEKNKAGRNKSKKTSNSFEFTSCWSDANNKVIDDLIDFTKTFFAKHTILNILTKYCVFGTDEILRVMRPYQIAATERILNRIKVAVNYGLAGSLKAGGYIWHTTGSGKTLTSFKTAQLAMQTEGIDKVVFVVDRNDLDYQTIREYENFQKGSVSQSKNADTLRKHLESGDGGDKIIVTTIQKLSIFIKKHKTHNVYNKNVVLIFDECHRSQFGDMHKLIVKYFKKYYLFGFTGTPIFALNAKTGGNIKMRTTEDAFGEKLHTYTILDAIRDGNVLKWKVDYINTVGSKDFEDEQISSIDREKALLNPRRIKKIVEYILDNFDRKTLRNDSGSYSFSKLMNIKDVAKNMNTPEQKEKRRLKGFNSILAAASVPAAKAYYEELQKAMGEEGDKKLKVALIYSYAPNEDIEENGILDEEDSDDTAGLDQSSRDFLDGAIADYNALFGTNYDTSAKNFPNYYKDVSLRMKNKELDILVVCNMFLTGFDATTLNTMWVDKSLRMHGLIQSFSRTNRILNSIKRYGNIVCFRNLDKRTEEALGLYGDKDAASTVLIRPFNDYFKGYNEKGKHFDGYVEILGKLNTRFPLGQEIFGENREKEFIRLFGKLLRLRNILTSFDEFEGQDTLSPYDLQNYTSIYIDLHDKYKPDPSIKRDISDDLEFELELVKQVEVNIDYILLLVEKYLQDRNKQKEILGAIDKAIGASTELRSKRELIERFIESINTSSNVRDDWHKFIVEQKDKDIETLIEQENLKAEETKIFLNNALQSGVLKTGGTDVNKLLPPMRRFGGGKRSEKLQKVIKLFLDFFEKFFGLV